jgi:hypothetical protein
MKEAVFSDSLNIIFKLTYLATALRVSLLLRFAALFL